MPKQLMGGIRNAYRDADKADLTFEDARHAGMNVDHAVAQVSSTYAGRHLWRILLGAFRGDILSYATLFVVVIVATTAVPLALTQTLSAFDRKVDVAPAATVLSVATIIMSGATWAATWRVRRLIARIELCVQRVIFRRLLQTDPAWLTAPGRSALSYVGTYPQQLSQVAFLVPFFGNAILIAVLALSMVVTYGQAGVVVLVCVAVLSIGLRALLRRGSTANHEYIATDHSRTRVLEAVATAWQSMRRQGLGPHVAVVMDQARHDQQQVLRRRARLMGPTQTLEDGIAQFMALATIGGTLLGTGWSASAVFGLLVLARLIAGPLRDNLSIYRTLRTAARATADLDELFTDMAKVEDPKSEVAVGTVWLSDPANERIDIRPGERVALVGRPGTGKTSLLRRIAQRRAEFGYAGTAVLVERGQAVFDGSLAEVITLWRRPVAKDEYVAAVTRSGLLPDLASRPQGDAAIVTSTEVTVSEGQLARIALAQAEYADPDVLLLDDIFAPLDHTLAASTAERILGADGRTRRPTRTIVFTTTRVEAIRYATRLLLTNGKRTLSLSVEEARRPESSKAMDSVIGQDLRTDLIAALDATLTVPAQSRITEPDGLQYEFPSQPPGIADVRGAAPSTALPRLAFVRNAIAVMPPAVRAIVPIATAAGVAADVAFAAVIDRSGGIVGGAALVCTLLMAVSLAVSLLRNSVAFQSSVSYTVALHRRLFEMLLGRDLGELRTTVAGRMGRDFFDVEMLAAETVVTVFAAASASLATVLVISIGRPWTAPVLLLTGAVGFIAMRSGRRAAAAASHVSAAARGDLLNLAVTGLSSHGVRLSPPIRSGVLARFDQLSTLRGLAMSRTMWARLRLLLSVEVVGAVIFLTALWSSIALPGRIVAPAVITYLAYTFSRELSAIVERSQTADNISTAFTRLADLLGRTTLPTLNHIVRTARRPDVPVEHGMQTAATGVRGDRLQIEAGGRIILDEVNVAVAKGEMLAVTGGSGVGKSTLLQTLAGYRKPASGSVRLPDPSCTAYLDSDILDLPFLVQDFCPRESVRAVFAAASQEPPQPNVLTTELSHGTRQLMNLARAISRQPSVLFLDEATSALDTTTERRLLAALPRLAPDAATVMALHRRANQDCADSVVELAVRDLVQHYPGQEGAPYVAAQADR
jgi:ABC-type multidrug transport system fused ATPase/permease subunit